jgi:calcineurin-like phosphoesterase family protein
MPSVFLISDTHFGHEKTCTEFKRADGSPMRPFSCAEEMDEFMVQRWNEVVRPSDKVYHLGDVVIQRKHLATVGRLNGDKVLLRGNHDIFKLPDYTKYFRDVRAYHVMNKMLLSHVPVHPSQLEYRFTHNIHGHLHEKALDDPRYVNVSVEHINYTPILFEELLKKIAKDANTRVPMS